MMSLIHNPNARATTRQFQPAFAEGQHLHAGFKLGPAGLGQQRQAFAFPACRPSDVAPKHGLNLFAAALRKPFLGLANDHIKGILRKHGLGVALLHSILAVALLIWLAERNRVKAAKRRQPTQVSVGYACDTAPDPEQPGQAVQTRIVTNHISADPGAVRQALATSLKQAEARRPERPMRYRTSSDSPKQSAPPAEANDWLANPANPLYYASPLNPAHQSHSSPAPSYEPPAHPAPSHHSPIADAGYSGASHGFNSGHSNHSSHSHDAGGSSYDSGSSYSSSDSSSSSSYDSGSSCSSSDY